MNLMCLLNQQLNASSSVTSDAMLHRVIVSLVADGVGTAHRQTLDMASIEDAVILAGAVGLLILRRDADANDLLSALPILDPIPAPTANASAALERTPGKRMSVPQGLRAKVYQRDRWICQYCGRRVIAPGIIEIIGNLCPIAFSFPSHNMPAGRTHPAAVRVYPNVDHVHAGSLGGAWRSEDNLVTACTRCNELKRDRLGWSPVAQSGEGWDGLTILYKAIAERTGDVGRYHLEWLKVLRIS